MMRFWKKVFFGSLFFLSFFLTNTDNVFSASCFYDGADSNGNPRRWEIQSGQGMCWYKGPAEKQFLNLQPNQGTDFWECQSDGSWKKTQCTEIGYLVGGVPYIIKSPGLCVDTGEAAGNAVCVPNPNKTCTFSDGRIRNNEGTMCANGNLYQCNGYEGKFFQKACGSGEQCFESSAQQAKCIKSGCSYTENGNLTQRKQGESACFQAELKRIGVCDNGNFKFKDCGGRCVRISDTYAECTDNNEKFCSEDGIERRMGQTACIDNKINLCGLGGRFGLYPNGDCGKQGKRCDTINEKGEGKCVDINTPTSPFLPGPGPGMGGGSIVNAFCEGMGPESGNPSINTALGCIPVEPGEFIVWLLPFVFGIAGGIAFLIMVYSFILMTTSAGDPKKIQGAKETMTAAIVGLLLSVFSLFILRLISVNILKIPGIN